MRHIELKASNPDNIYDIKGIINLFYLSYQDTFPNHEVYNEEFWRERIGNRFISIIAKENDEVVGHIACCPQKEDKENVQIIMPVVIPCDYEQEILNKLWEKVEGLAKKKSWKMAFKFITSYPQKMEQTISKIGNFNEIALYPGHKKEESLNDIQTETSYPVLYSQHTFDSSKIKKEKIYVPSQYKDIVEKFYKDISIQREFANNDDNNSLLILDDAKPVELKSYRHTGLCRLYVTPSLLPTFNKSQISFDNSRFYDALIYVNLFDSKCPLFCEFLEDMGYSFSGVIPLIDGGDYIIYTKSLENLKENHFTKASAEALRENILRLENSRNIEYKEEHENQVAHF